MKMTEKLAIIWKGISIDISYNPDYSKAYKEIYGHPLAHLEIMAEGRHKLPMTGTGYRSHFTHASGIEGYGGAEKFVMDWLDHDAQSKEWKDYIDQGKQLALF